MYIDAKIFTTGCGSVNNYVTNELQRETETTELMEDTNQVKR